MKLETSNESDRLQPIRPARSPAPGRAPQAEAAPGRGADQNPRHDRHDRRLPDAQLHRPTRTTADGTAVPGRFQAAPPGAGHGAGRGRRSGGRKSDPLQTGRPGFCLDLRGRLGRLRRIQMLPRRRGAGAQTDQPGLRGIRRFGRGRGDGAALLEKRETPAGAGGAGLRRLRRSGHERRPAGAQPFRGRSDRGLQRRQPRAGEIAGRSARAGLCPRGFFIPGEALRRGV